MHPRPYLPSAQFMLVLGALGMSLGLVYAAQYITHPRANALAEATPQTHTTEAQWQAQLDAIEAQSGVSLPTAPNQTQLSNVLQAIQSSNFTETVGRSLLVNLANAKSQGLGNDIPTQDQILSSAQNQLPATIRVVPYTKNDLVIVADTKESKHAYGNAVMTVLSKHPKASNAETLALLAQAVDTASASGLSNLPAIGQEYAKIAQELALVPVPQTLTPLHAQILNEYASMSNTYAPMALLMTDPLQGISGFQQYLSLVNETRRVFTNVAQNLNKDGILFTKDEPGATWATLLSGQ